MSATYPAVLPPGINLHVAAVVGILQQTVVLEEQPGALAQSLALVVVILLDELLHQLEQTLGVPGIPVNQVLRWKPDTGANTLEPSEWDLEGRQHAGGFAALFRVADF